MGSIEERVAEISRAAEMADVFLRARRDTIIMTSRELVTGKSWSQPFLSFSSFSSVQLIFMYYIQETYFNHLKV